MVRSSSFRALSVLVLTLTGCPGPTMDDAGTDDGGVDTGGDRPDAPRDTGVDSPTDAGRETDCTGTDCAFVELDLAASSSCARRMNGDVICWGEGQEAQLGDGRMRHVPGCPVPEGMPVDCTSTPVLVSLTEPALELGASASFFCAVTGTERTHRCWGLRGYRIDGDTPTRRFAPEVEALFTGTVLDDGGSRACWLDEGAVMCIGSNGAGQLGNGDRTESFVPVAATRRSDSSPITSAVEVDGGVFGGLTCARTPTEVLCWGINDNGQLGDGVDDHMPDDCGDAASAIDCSLRAVNVSVLDGAHVLDLAVGFDHACALVDDGTVFCWGAGGFGQLGTGDNARRGTPTLVAGLTDVVQITANANSTCARRGDGTVACWGQSDLGQVGDGAETHEGLVCSSGGRFVDCQLTPSDVSGLSDATDISTGFSHSCAIREAGGIVCWGRNDRYQLGDGTRDARYAPVPVGGL